MCLRSSGRSVPPELFCFWPSGRDSCFKARRNFMSLKPATDTNRPMDSSAPARSPTKSRRAHERRRTAIIGSCVLALAGLGCALVLKAQFPISTRPAKLFTATATVTDNSNRSAKVLIDSGDGGCRQERFDNETWRMTRSQQPCELTARDSVGNPIPLGTIHRLDAISKSFK
jgi:hypothetical protein